jgi:hypothetical protein
MGSGDGASNGVDAAFEEAVGLGPWNPGLVKPMTLRTSIEVFEGWVAGLGTLIAIAASTSRHNAPIFGTWVKGFLPPVPVVPPLAARPSEDQIRGLCVPLSRAVCLVGRPTGATLRSQSAYS